MAIFTSSYCKTQLEDIASKMIEYRGISEDEEIDYNGIKYKAGDIMNELRKDYEWWSDKYNTALVAEGSSSTSNTPEYKLAKGWEI